MPERPIGLSSFVLASPFSDEHLSSFAEVKAMGYDLVEICVQELAGLSAERVRGAAAQAGLALSVGAVFGPGQDPSHPDPAQRRSAAEQLAQCIEFAAEIGAVIVSGPLYAAPGKLPAASDAERSTQRGWAVDCIRAAADQASRHGISLAIEPLNRFETDLVNTVEQGLELCELVGRDNVGLALDTFHMNIEEKSPADAIRSAGARVLSVQASENDRGIPGSGSIDWTGIALALDDIGYGGPVVVESFVWEVPELARAVSIWRPVASSMDALARESIGFVRRVFT